MLQRGRPGTAEELGNALGVSRRTVLQDLALLRRVGIVYWFDRASQTYLMEQGDPFEAFSFSDEEAMAVMLVTENMQDISFVPNPAAAVSAGRKLEGVVPRSQRERIAPGLSKLRICNAPDPDRLGQEQSLSALRDAAVNRRKIEVLYAQEDGNAARRLMLHPYFLTFQSDQWHLVGFDPERQQVGSYRVSQFTEVDCCRSSFFEAPLALETVV